MKTRIKYLVFGLLLSSLLWAAIYSNGLALPPEHAPVADERATPCLSHIIEASYTSYYDCNFPISERDAQTGTLNFLSSYATPLGMTNPAENLSLLEIKHGLASTHVRYQQILEGYPVFGAYVSVHQGPNGEVQTVHVNFYPDLQTEPVATKRLTPTEADQAGQSLAGVTALRDPSRAQLVWFPNKDGSATLAWQMTIYSEQPLGDFLTVVDAYKGNVLLQENRIATDSGSGLVYVPNPYQTQGNNTGMVDGSDATNANLDAQRINVTLQGLDSGTGLLRGEYVDLSTLNSGTLPDVDANEPTRVYNYDRADDRFEQVVIYHSIDSIQRYFQSLGFSDSNVPANGIRDYATLANAHWYTADQSFYSTGNNAVHFGDGGVDDGEDADIIAHEYGHAVQHDQNVNWGGGHMGAMGEAFGDYLAASFYLANGNGPYQTANAACVGEWDAVSYSGSNPPCLRRVDGTKIYPDDLVGQVHADGEIWSRALWDIRLAVGAPADAIVLEHHFALPASATMPTAALAMVQADLNLNGGANEADIRDAFCDRGILTGDDCVVTPPDVNLCSAPNLDIPDASAAGVEDTLTINANATLTDLNVDITANHSFVGDLIFSLEHVDTGTSVTLIDQPGKPAQIFGCGGANINATLDDAAASAVEDECAGSTPTIAGSFSPNESLSAFNGEDLSGDWTLTVSDNEGGDTGSLVEWCLSPEPDPTDSNDLYLPIIVRSCIPAALLSPTQNEAIAETIFDWADVAGATSYKIEFSTASDFSSISWSNTGAASQYGYTSNISGAYYWRVTTYVSGEDPCVSSGRAVTLVDYDGDDDGDSLWNGWELHGYSVDSGAGPGRAIDVDLPALGASYRHKDIFVEMDYMVRASADNGLGPNQSVLDTIVDVFADAPVTNPDGVTGINIHLDLDDQVPYDADLNPYFSQITAIKNANFDSERAAIYHYMIWANGHSGGSSSGVSLGIPATDFVVTLGLWNGNEGGTDYQKIGTFIHELGHNLNLTHGGSDHSNYKPNYLSVMNYAFQITGVYREGSWYNFDYQRFTIPSLNENSLNETLGLNTASANGYGTVYFCPGGGSTSDLNVSNGINWNCDGDSNDTNVSVDINASGKIDTLSSQDNWANIVYNGGGPIGSGLAPAEILAQAFKNFVDPELVELDYELAQQIEQWFEEMFGPLKFGPSD